jgi:hypothetical protein
MAVPVWATNDVPTATDFNVWLTNTITVIKSSTESVTSSTTLQDDDELVIALAANSDYWIDGIIFYDAGTVGDIKIQFTGPASATCALALIGISTGAAGGGDYAHGTYTAFSNTSSFGGTGAGDMRSILVGGMVHIAGTAGNFRFRWAQDTSSSGATRVFAPSTFTARRIN